MDVPFFKYRDMFAMHANEYRAAIDSVVGRGAFILQTENETFERELEAYTGARHAIGVANGTDAIIIALRAAGIGPGDEVVLPSHTYIATAAAVHFVGATPVLVECAADHLIDPDAADAAVGPKTTALMPVQLNGRTADMDRLQAIADKHGLVIVEDSAQGVGSRFKGRMAGTFGKAGTYSFYPAKTLGSLGDAGGIVTDDDAVYEMAWLLHDHGRNPDGKVISWGLNSRLDNLQAGILSVRLHHLQDEINRRRAVASLYQEGLGDLEELALPPAPGVDADHYDVYQNYEIEADRRDQLKDFLKEHGVGSIIQWGGTPVHHMTELGVKANLPYTDRLFERCLLLPMNSMLSDAEIAYVVERVRAFYRG